MVCVVTGAMLRTAVFGREKHAVTPKTCFSRRPGRVRSMALQSRATELRLSSYGLTERHWPLIEPLIDMSGRATCDLDGVGGNRPSRMARKADMLEYTL